MEGDPVILARDCQAVQVPRICRPPAPITARVEATDSSTWLSSGRVPDLMSPARAESTEPLGASSARAGSVATMAAAGAARLGQVHPRADGARRPQARQHGLREPQPGAGAPRSAVCSS